MSVIHQLASSLGRRDETPNQELAQKIAASNKKVDVQELVDNLKNKDKDIQNDCIKVLYEIGTLKPELIADYAKDFISLLDNKNNRLQWGAMTAIHAITPLQAKLVYNALPKIIAVADSGSVITKDYAVNILIRLAAIKTYAEPAFNLLLEQLSNSPTNQLPMYAEKALPIINDQNKNRFIQTLTSRLSEIEKDSKRIRVEKVIRKLK